MTDEGKMFLMGAAFVFLIALIILGPFIGLGGASMDDEHEDDSND